MTSTCSGGDPESLDQGLIASGDGLPNTRYGRPVTCESPVAMKPETPTLRWCDRGEGRSITR